MNTTAASLAGQAWLEEPALRAVLAALDGDGRVTRIAGGAVRDALLGDAVNDIDLATELRPDEVCERCRRAGLQVVPTGIDHGTVTVLAGRAGRRRPFEVTTLRVDVETHGRHATVAFTDDWAGDAARRDFTINALYCDGAGRVYDYVGGLADIAARKVRFVGDPHARIREDYLRILRFFRFAGRYQASALDGAALAACREERAGLARLSRERVRDELLKLLATPGAASVLAAMAEAQVLEHVAGGRYALDDAQRMIEIERGLGHGADPLRRLAALYLPAGFGADALKTALRLSNRQRERLAALEATAGADGWRAVAAGGEGDDKLRLYRLGALGFVDAMLLAWALSGAPVHDAEWARRAGLPERWSAPVLPVDGGDIVALGVPQGREVGQLLAAAETMWTESGFTLGREELLGQLKQLQTRN